MDGDAELLTFIFDLNSANIAALREYKATGDTYLRDRAQNYDQYLKWCKRVKEGANQKLGSKFR